MTKTPNHTLQRTTLRAVTELHRYTSDCMKRATQILLMLVLSANLLIGAEIKHNYKPKDGYVPNAETAIRIAVAVWIPIYGADNIARQKPYVAILKGGIWYVSGSLPEGSYGGTAIAEIAKDDGRVLRVSHEV